MDAPGKLASLINNARPQRARQRLVAVAKNCSQAAISQ